MHTLAPPPVDPPRTLPACDPASFALAARASLGAAYRGALAVVDRRADAEDVAQDAMLAAFEKLDTCRDAACFRSWLLQIVRNRALNWLDRRRLRDVPAVVVEPQGDLHFPVLPDVSLRRRLRAAMAGLGPTQREVVVLHDVEGWTHQEIADHLGTSVLMSRKHLFQARARLRVALVALAGDHPGRPETAGEGAALPARSSRERDAAAAAGARPDPPGNRLARAVKRPGNTGPRSPVLKLRHPAPAIRADVRGERPIVAPRSATG